MLDSVEDAVRRKRANTSIVFVPAPYAKDAAVEAIEAGIRLLVIITERIPFHDALDIIPYARTWSIETRDQIPLAITLRVGQEGRTIHEILFYSMSAPTGLRPQLRLTFVPRLQIGPP